MEISQPSVLNISLTIEEYFLVCYLMEAPGPFGNRNLPSSQDPEQIRAFLERGKTSLVGKELLAVDMNGDIELDYVLAKMGTSVCQAHWTFIANKTRADTTQELFIHMGSDLLVEQITEADKIELTALENISIFLDRLETWLSLPDVPEAPGELVELEADILDKARHIALSESFEGCEKFFLVHQVPAHAAKIFAAALGKDGWSGSFTLLNRSKEPSAPIETLGWLISSEGSYCIFPHHTAETDLMHIFPVSTEGIWKRVIKILDFSLISKFEVG